MKKVNEKFQLVPPHIHRRNSAERTIQTFKDHFIAGLASTNRDFPLHLWCRLLPHACLTIKLLRQSRLNPKLSGYAQLHGQFNYNATPLAPPGTKVIVHEKPSTRKSWAVKGQQGWYLGPFIEHCRCHHVYITKTRGERDSDCVEFPPHNTPLLFKSSAENATITALELANALKNPAPPTPYSNIGDDQMATIHQLSQIYSRITNTLQEKSIEIQTQRDIPQQSILGQNQNVPLPTNTKPNIPKSNPNIIEDDNGDLPTINYKVHTGKHIIPPDPPSLPRVNTYPPPRVNDGPSTNLRSRYAGG